MNMEFAFADEKPLIVTASLEDILGRLSPLHRAIHERAATRAATYLTAEAELLDSIIEIDRNKAYEEFGSTHLTPHCVKYLGLSEDVAAVFVRVARKSQEVPELQQAVDDGRICITKAKTISSVITPENSEEWIEKASTQSKNTLEREIATAKPSQPKPERAKPVSAELMRVEFELAHAEMVLFRRAQDLVSQSLKKPATLAETAVEALNCLLDRRDPMKKAERSARRPKPVSNPTGPGTGPENCRLISFMD